MNHAQTRYILFAGISPNKLSTSAENTTPGVNSEPERRFLNSLRTTRIAVTYSDGTPLQIVEFTNPEVTLFSELIAKLPGNPSSLISKYPRREYTLSEHGSKSLTELELQSNPSLMTKGQVIRQQQLRHESGKSLLKTIIDWIWSWIKWIFSLFFGRNNDRSQEVQLPGNNNHHNRRMRDPKSLDQAKKPNQYWNGDSTVFEGPDDGGSNDN